MQHSLNPMGIFFFSTICTLLGFSTPVLAATDNTQSTEVFFSLHGFGSGGSDMEGMSNQAVGFGWIAQGGIRMNQLGLFFECQRDRWLATEQTVEIVNGVFNVGVGAHVLLFNERLKVSISSGTTTLVFDAIFDKAGTTGIYLDVHPTILRWPLSKRMVLELSPIGMSILVPAVREPILRRLEYRTTFGVEVTF